jgi:hypothetical protein
VRSRGLALAIKPVYTVLFAAETIESPYLAVSMVATNEETTVPHGLDREIREEIVGLTAG